jgi:serine/threonine-protein kinase
VDPQPTSPTDPLIAGSEVGPYRLVQSLGKGGMAEVFLAVHRHLGHLRAVKVLQPDAADLHSARAKRLLTEGRAISRLRHPAIVQVFDCDVLPAGGAFIAMEHLQGEASGHWLERLGSLSGHPEVAAALVGVVADALAHAHGLGIVHRDVKPDNLFLLPDPQDPLRFSVKVLDFGVAKILNEKPLVKTRTGCAVGTPVYMAPEQWQGGAATIDHRSDIYSLGCVFYELLSGQVPFIREDGLQLMQAHLTETPSKIRALAPEVPPELEGLLERMLAKRPEDRPQTMDEVVAPLEAILERDRTRFPELLRAPESAPVASGPPVPADVAALGEPIPRKNPTPPRSPTPATTTVTEKRTRWSPLRLGIAAALAVTIAGAGAVIAARMIFTPPAGETSPPEKTAPPPQPPAPPPPQPAIVPSEPPAATAPPVATPPPAGQRAARPRPRKNVYQPVGD